MYKSLCQIECGGTFLTIEPTAVQPPFTYGVHLFQKSVSTPEVYLPPTLPPSLYQVAQISAQLENEMNTANEASDLMENEQMEKRELEEKLNEATVSGSNCEGDDIIYVIESKKLFCIYSTFQFIS